MGNTTQVCVMTITDWISLITAIAAIVSAIAALIAVAISKKELKQAFTDANENRKSDSLKIVLEIESQMNLRKSEFDKAAKQLGETMSIGNCPEEQISILTDYMETTKENYYNSLDRFCFCCLKGYLEDEKWRADYRNLIHTTIKSDESSFGAGTPYRNMVELNDKWQSE